LMHDEDFATSVPKKGAYFLEGLQELKRRHKIIGDVDGLGLALRVEICEPHDSFTPSKSIVDRMVDEALKGDLDHGGKRYGLVLDIGGGFQKADTPPAPPPHPLHEDHLGVAPPDTLLAT